MAIILFDPLSRPTISAYNDHCFHTYRHYIRLYVRPYFQNLSMLNKFQVNTMIPFGGTLGLTEWIIDDPSLVRKLLILTHNSVSVNSLSFLGVVSFQSYNVKHLVYRIVSSNYSNVPEKVYNISQHH